jgi:hypothetical protein
MEPIKAQVTGFEGSFILVDAADTKYRLDPLKQRKVSAKKPKARLTLLGKEEVGWEAKASKQSTIKIADEVYILSVIGKPAAEGKRKLAGIWATASDFEAVVQKIKPKPDFIGLLELYDELVSRAAESIALVGRAPVFIEVPGSPALTALGLQRGYFCVIMSDEELKRFEPLGATRADMSKTEIVIEGTVDGTIEVFPYDMSKSTVRRVYGLLPDMSYSRFAWNSELSCWDEVEAVKVNLGKAEDSVIAVCLVRIASNKLVGTAYPKIMFKGVTHNLLILGDRSAARFANQDLRTWRPGQ